MDTNSDDLILFDMLSMENEAAKSYDFALISCTTKSLHGNLITILCDQHQMCLDVKDELLKRKYISLSECDQEEMLNIREKFK